MFNNGLGVCLVVALSCSLICSSKTSIDLMLIWQFILFLEHIRLQCTPNCAQLTLAVMLIHAVVLITFSEFSRDLFRLDCFFFLLVIPSLWGGGTFV